MQPFFKWLGFPIRKSADQFIFADPRSLSQLITSFFASESQGIPRVPFLTFFYACAFCAAGYVFIICSVIASLYHLVILPLLLMTEWLCDWMTSTTSLLLSSLFQFTSSNMSKNLSDVQISDAQMCRLFYSSAYLHISSFTHSQVENNGFEPLTPCVQGRCSSQLS